MEMIPFVVEHSPHIAREVSSRWAIVFANCPCLPGFASEDSASNVVWNLELRCRKEIDRINNRHRNDIFLCAEIEREHAFNDLICEDRRVHARRVQDTQ